MRRHERRLRIVLLRILDDTRDVEEAVQDAFVSRVVIGDHICPAPNA